MWLAKLNMFLIITGIIWSIIEIKNIPKEEMEVYIEDIKKENKGGN